MVVNCFRSLYLWVDLQRRCRDAGYAFRCELLSFFVPLGWFTAGHYISTTTAELWIAFVLCTFGLIYSSPWTSSSMNLVVNCFRSLYLWVDLQPPATGAGKGRCCELLSFFVPLGWFTAGELVTPLMLPLWIAFVLCTFGLIYSHTDFWRIL